MPTGVFGQVALLTVCMLLACSSAPKAPPPAPLPKPQAPPPAPEPPEAALRAQPPGDAWLAEPAPHGIELGVDNPATVAQKLDITLELSACRKRGSHWSKPDTGRLKGNYLCTIEHPELDDAKQLELSFVELSDDLIVLDALSIAFDPGDAEWDARIAALESERGPADVSFMSPVTARAWSWGRVEIRLERPPATPHAWLRYVDRHAAYRYLARAIKTKQVQRIVPRPKTIPPAEPFGLLFATDGEADAREKLEAAGFTIEPCRTLADRGREGRVIDCTLTGAPIVGLRGARIQLADIGDGRMRLALLEYQLDPARFSRAYGELESQYGPVEHETLGAENEAAWWIDPVQIAMLGNTQLLVVSYRHGRLAQIAANLTARSNRSTTRSADQVISE